MWTTYYDDLVGEYGFKDAFNLTYVTAQHPNGWFDVDYLGIEQGHRRLDIGHQDYTAEPGIKSRPGRFQQPVLMLSLAGIHAERAKEKSD